jgi:hypothetical protein
MEELGCEAGLLALIEQLPEDVDVLVNEGVGDFLPLAGAAGATAGLYMNVRHCHLALAPADAEGLAAKTGCRVRARGQTTHHVKVTAAVAADPKLQSLLIEYTAIALRRSAATRRPAPHGPAVAVAPAAADALDFPGVALNVRQSWREGMDIDEVYDITRGSWVVGRQREQAEYAVAVAKGLVRGVFLIHGWRPRHLADDGGHAKNARWGFDGEPSLEHEHLIGADVSELFPQGAANPVRYLNLSDESPTVIPSAWESDRPASAGRSDALASLCAQLQANPVLHLSLTSKELFHSNLLGWLFERSADLAVDVLRPLLKADPAQSLHAVQRESHHLDLVVHLPGYRPVVVENKVFSLPHEEQLDGYAAKNIPAAGLAGATKVLLSLSDPGWPEGRYGSWTWLSYEDVAARLLPSVEKHLPGDRFTAELVRHWTSMVAVLRHIAVLTAPSPAEPLLLDADAVELLRGVRLQDVFQKLRTRRVRHLLQQHLEGSAVEVDDLESSFTNGSPLLSGRLAMPDGSEIGWQLQGSQWRRFVITPEQLMGRTEVKRQERIAYADAKHSSWFAFSPEQALGPFPSAPSTEYKHFAPGFLYDYIRIPGISVLMVLQLAELVLREAAVYRGAWHVDISNEGRSGAEYVR